MAGPKKKASEKKGPGKKWERGKKKHVKIKGPGKKNYWPRKLTARGQFHPIHEISEQDFLDGAMVGVGSLKPHYAIVITITIPRGLGFPLFSGTMFFVLAPQFVLRYVGTKSFFCLRNLGPFVPGNSSHVGNFLVNFKRTHVSMKKWHMSSYGDT
jgi:hypothetical protein